MGVRRASTPASSVPACADVETEMAEEERHRAGNQSDVGRQGWLNPTDGAREASRFGEVGGSGTWEPGR
jgi:hypothetical protein